MSYGDMLEAGFAVVTKRRINATTVASSHLVGDVRDKVCVITDDLTSTAGTLCAAAKILKANGAARIYCAVSHCILNESGKEKLLGDAGDRGACHHRRGSDLRRSRRPDQGCEHRSAAW